jgi:hypothetical protein
MANKCQLSERRILSPENEKMRQHHTTLMILFVLILCTIGSVHCAYIYTIKSIDASLEIDDVVGCTGHVVETLVVSVGSTPITTFARVLPDKYSYKSISSVPTLEVTSNDVVISNVEAIRVTSGISFRVEFNSVSNKDVTFRYTYQYNMLSGSKSTKLNYVRFGYQFAVPKERINYRLTLPSYGISSQDIDVVIPSTLTAVKSDNVITVTNTTASIGSAFDISVQFPLTVSSCVAVGPKEVNRTALGIGLGVGLGILVVILVIWSILSFIVICVFPSDQAKGILFMMWLPCTIAMIIMGPTRRH